jgi:hypothetical protein
VVVNAQFAVGVRRGHGESVQPTGTHSERSEVLVTGAPIARALRRGGVVLVVQASAK